MTQELYFLLYFTGKPVHSYETPLSLHILQYTEGIEGKEGFSEQHKQEHSITTVVNEFFTTFSPLKEYFLQFVDEHNAKVHYASSSQLRLAFYEQEQDRLLETLTNLAKK